MDGVEIPLEYVERGLDWMKRQTSVDSTRIGVIGFSKGAELALLMAGLRARDFKAAVAVSPTSVVLEGYFRNPRATGEGALKPGRSTWSYEGKPLPFLRKALTPEIRAWIEREGAVGSIDFYVPAYHDEAAVERARIQVETIEAPVLLVASEADGMWPSAEMARDIEAVMRARNTRCESLIYPDSSHVIDEAWLPPIYGTHAPRSAGRWDKTSIGGTSEGMFMPRWTRGDESERSLTRSFAPNRPLKYGDRPSSSPSNPIF